MCVRVIGDDGDTGMMKILRLKFEVQGVVVTLAVAAAPIDIGVLRVQAGVAGRYAG